MVWALEMYRILAYRRMADLLQEAERTRLAAQADTRRRAAEAGPTGAQAGSVRMAARVHEPRVAATPAR